MKIVFEYKGKETKLKVPKSLMYINWLLEETEIEGNWIWTDSYDYMIDKLCKIFADKYNLNKNKIYAELLDPKDEENAPFRVRILDDDF